MDVDLISKEWIDEEVCIDHFDETCEEGALVAIDVDKNNITIKTEDAITEISGNDIEKIYLK